jgi:hypothetical protein
LGSSRGNILHLALTAEMEVALNKVSAKLENDRLDAGRVVFNAGLWALRDLSEYKQMDFDTFDTWYRRKAVDVRDENRRKRNSHTSAREQALRQIKEIANKDSSVKKIETSIEKEQRLNDLFAKLLVEWPTRDLDWRRKHYEYAKKNATLPNAMLILAKWFEQSSDICRSDNCRSKEEL